MAFGRQEWASVLGHRHEPDQHPLTVKVSYSDTLGNSTSNTQVCTNSTITVPDAGAVCPPGNTGTFVISVTGQPDQVFHVTFQ